MLGIPLVVVLLATTTSNQMTTGRKFQFVPYGSSFDSPDRPTISCDGRIPGGVTLELTHWTGNQTPDKYYADTSTEMAIKLAKNPPTLQDALILNNHYDTDGVLSVWACLEPNQALLHEKLLIQGAEAGDFGEWSSDEGVKLDCSLGTILQQADSEEEAYKSALEELPALLNDLEENKGMTYEKLWKDEWEYANKGWEDIQHNGVVMERYPSSKLVIFSEASPIPLSPYALHRGLIESDLWSDTTRILRVSPNNKFQYEKSGHGWVQKLIQRHIVPPVDDCSELVKHLNTKFDTNVWSASGGGLVSICRTTASLDKEASPQAVAQALVELDSGCQL